MLAGGSPAVGSSAGADFRRRIQRRSVHYIPLIGRLLRQNSRVWELTASAIDHALVINPGRCRYPFLPVPPHLHKRFRPRSRPAQAARQTSGQANKRRQQALLGKAAGRSVMAPAAFPALPPDVWARIAREALAAEGSTVEARVRLGLVCRAWEDALHGAHSLTFVLCPCV